MLWQMILQRISFICATGVFDRTDAPNFRFSIENVVSTFDRLW